MPLCPARMACHAVSTALPTGEIIPKPVTTTRRLLTRYPFLTGSWGILRRVPPPQPRGSPPANPARILRARRPKVAALEPAAGLSGLVAPLVDVLDRLVNRGDLLGILVRNLDLELLLESHHELDRVERVGSQIVHEGGVIGHLLLLDAKLLGHDGFDLLLNCAH